MPRVLALIPVLAVCAVRSAAAQAGSIRYSTGEVTYRQKEMEITLALVPGGTYAVDTARGRREVTLSFAPSGTPEGTPTFYLYFWISGGRPVIGALEVPGGQGGNAYFDEPDSGCALAITRLDAQVMEGAGACTGPFEGGGAPIVSFRFIARQ